jgi:putative ATPase
MDDLFTQNVKKLAPLSERMRPCSLDDFVGQEHIVGQKMLLRRAISTDVLGSCIFWGPAGSGKTTLANIIALSTKGHFEKLNAVTSGVADAKRVIEEAKNRLKLFGKKTFLLLDECHRWSKAQSDCVLPAIEDGSIIFIGSTTENPFVSLTTALVSRCRVFEFRAIDRADIIKALERAAADAQKGLGNLNIKMSEDAKAHFAFFSGGDLRLALNALELAALTTAPNAASEIIIDKNAAEQSIQKKSLSVDETLYYDILSAFCKSLRGSDPNAALYYFERLITAGCDPMLLARRLVVHSSEDVGMADANALVVATSAMYALEKIGLPEARIPLANAIIYVCLAPKSNAVVTALAAASEDAQKYAGNNVPAHLRDNSYRRTTESIEKTPAYKYPHDYGGYVRQQYLPDELKDKKYYK